MSAPRPPKTKAAPKVYSKEEQQLVDQRKTIRTLKAKVSAVRVNITKNSTTLKRSKHVAAKKVKQNCEKFAKMLLAKMAVLDKAEISDKLFDKKMKAELDSIDAMVAKAENEAALAERLV